MTKGERHGNNGPHQVVDLWGALRSICRRKEKDMNKRGDLAGILSIAGVALSLLAGFVETQQRKQDNHEIALEVARLLKEGM